MIFLYYYKSIQENNTTYSCDSVVIDGVVEYLMSEYLMEKISGFKINNVEVDYFQSWKIGNFHHLWTFRFDSGCSCTLQWDLNNGNKHNDKIRLDYNPNKCNSDRDFVLFHNLIVSNCRNLYLKRWDLAIDYAVERENCFLIKDQRKYSEVSLSKSDKTQYLGCRSQDGFVKLYNKQIESKLDSPLTRLELTLGGSKAYDGISFPLVYVLDTKQLQFGGEKLTDTDRFILHTLLLDSSNINMLGRKMKAKMDKILKSYTYQLDISERAYYSILNIAREQYQLLDEPITLVEYSSFEDEFKEFV